MKKNTISAKQLRKDLERIFAENRNKAFNHKQLAAKLALTSSEAKDQIIRLLYILEKEGMTEEIMPGKYVLKHINRFTEGTIQITQRGLGYVVSDDPTQEDVLIDSEHLNTALNGDRVKVNLFAYQISGKPSGEVVEIIKRARATYVGVVQLAYNYAFVVPDDKRMYVDIFIPLEKINKAKNGQKVIARITEWDTTQKNPFGEITEILGMPGDHQTEMHAIINEFGFQMTFPQSVEKDAENIPNLISEAEVKNRKDFRNILTFTIDPEDAKDFDDALSIRELETGVWEVGVHIADVSHYVSPDSALDKEAYERATSVYLVDRTIPMLPEKLSNGVCSLRPNEDKLTFSTVFKMNAEGQVLDTWIGKTIIHSKKRFTYEEAQLALETHSGIYADELITLNTMALALRKKRFEQGAVNFETEEIKFKLDEHFKPTGIFKKVRKDAHKLIEEFMLLSNRTVATYAHKLGKGEHKKTFVYRVHEAPNEDKLKVFSMFASRFGYQIKTTSDKAIAQSFNKLLTEVEGKPEQNIIQSMAVRSMMKAYYTTQKTGHYGLAFDYYTHFTSPIRRYPDLLVHRLLYAYLNKGKSANEKQYEEMCKHSSQMEIQAADAERASVRYKQVEYIRDFIGHTFAGIISGVSEWGIYVEITEYKCEGMIRLNALADDYYEYDAGNQWIIGRSTKKIFQLGGIVDVVVKQADVNKRQIDLDLATNQIHTKLAGKKQKHKRKEELRAKAIQKNKPKKKRRR